MVTAKGRLMRSRFYIISIFSISLLFGQISFTDRIINENPINPVDVDAVDLDQDGDMDLVVIEEGIKGDLIINVNPQLVWYENNGSESFTRNVILANAVEATDVIAIDVDSDGDIDLVYGAGDSNNDVSVAWYENDGQESFTARTIANYATAQSVRAVYAADIDTDGDMDVLSASFNDNKVNWYKNNGSQSFTAATITTIGTQARDIFPIDLDGDGDMDVISGFFNNGSSDDGRLVWSENNGSESFTTHTISTTINGIYRVRGADIDGDGDIDVLSASAPSEPPGRKKYSWYENNGSQSFTEHVIQTGVLGKDIHPADMDLDGDMDILVSSQNNGVVWFENIGDPDSFLEHPIEKSFKTHEVIPVDMDNDGDIDVVAVGGSQDYPSGNPINGLIKWYENTMDKGMIGSWTAANITTSADGATSVFAVDVDNDGDMDVLSASLEDKKIAWYENNGSQSFTAHTIATNDGAWSVYAADLDNDGDVDILASGYTIKWYENNGSQSFTANTVVYTGEMAYSVFAVDLDNDGDMDVLSASMTDDKIAWYENDGAADPSWTAADISTSADGARSVYAADVDGDGDMDVLSASDNDNKIAWYENNGSESFTEHSINTSASAAHSVFAVDMDRDGDMDVLSAAAGDDKVAWYENNGSESFTEHSITTSAWYVRSIYAVDVDNDGDMDVLSASFKDDKIAWYENNGSQSFTAHNVNIPDPDNADNGPLSMNDTPEYNGNANGAYYVYALDIDGDGDIDVLSASGYDDKIAWYKNSYDAIVPTVSSVSSTNDNGTYKIGDVIVITIALSEAAIVTGTPRIKLETGTTDQYATYASGSTTTTLTFNYTVTAGDTTADLDYTSTSALELNSGTIKDASGNVATLTLASPGASGSLGANKAIVIDGNVPTVTSVTSTKTNRGYTVGTTIPITITFNQTVTVTGTPQLTLETGATDAVVDYASGTGTATLTFNYVVAAGHTSSDLDYTSTSALALNSGTIKDASGNAATLTLATPGATNSLGANKTLIIDTTSPTVSSVSSTKADAAYKVGEAIPINVNFDDKVYVTGTPQLTLETGTTDAVVDYSSGSETTTLTFNYTVASSHNSSDLGYGSTSALALNSGTVKDSLGNAATLSLPAPGATGSLGANKAIIIDNLPPTLTLDPVDGSTAVLPTLPISINFNEYVRLSDNTEATSTNVDALITLKDTDASGTDIAFDATINTAKTVITIDPTADFSSEQTVYVTISASLEDTLDHATSAASATLKMKDVIVPTVAFDPTNGSTDVPGNRNITLTFSEPIRNIDNSEITESNIAGLVTLKGNSASGADFNYGATINAEKTVITVDPLFDFSASSVVYVGIGAVVEDDADNAIVASSVLYITGIPDVIGPAVSNVTSANADSSYKNGSSIIITISFNEVAIVTGTPQLTLETGTTDGVANYSSGSGTKDLNFTYNVTSDHNTAHLDYESSNALTKNEGTIKDFVGNSANLALPNPGAENSLGANKTIVIDHFIPVISLVAEGTLTGEDKDYQTVSTTMDISWAGTDTISGISKYEYALGTTSGGTEVKTWTNAATVTSVSLSGLSLSDGSKYYASVKATDKAENVSVVKTGDGITIDITAPTTGTVNDGTGEDIATISSTTTLSANWTGFSDANSGIASYEYAIGTTSGGTDTKNWTSNGLETTFTLTDLTLIYTNSYFVSVRANDNAGNVSNVATSSGAGVDLYPGPPSITAASKESNST